MLNPCAMLKTQFSCCVAKATQHSSCVFNLALAVADPGFPVGGRGTRRGGRGLPRWLHFTNFVCQNERIWTLREGVRRARPLNPPMTWV